MYCQTCANKLPEGAKFCNKCGNPVPSLSVEVSANPVVAVEATDLVLPASILRRLSNFLIDRFASYVPLIFCSMYFVYFPSTSDSDTIQSVIIGVAGILFFAYHLICESIWQRTLGKLITKTKVVDKNGNKPSFLKILGRSLARYIPFEPLSFLFSGYPIGWHDSLSNTLVVPNHLTPEEVRKMNVAEIKRHKSNNAVGIVIAILIGTLVVIAIIGILSSVVLASLNSARIKARDARRVADVRQIQIAEELYYDANGKYASAISDLVGYEKGQTLLVEPKDPTTSMSYNFGYKGSSHSPIAYHIGADLEQLFTQTALGDKDVDFVSKDAPGWTFGFDGGDDFACDGVSVGMCYSVSNVDSQ